MEKKAKKTDTRAARSATRGEGEGGKLAEQVKAEKALADYLRGLALAPQEAAELVQLSAKAQRPVQELVQEAIRQLLQRERERMASRLPRVKMMGDDMAKVYGQAIFEQLGQAKARGWGWVVVDYQNRTVAASERHPGNQKKTVALDTRADKAEQWLDIRGQLTPRSVLACLMGYARPDGGA